jgi:tetratricopeptide (TPR) repeat protein
LGDLVLMNSLFRRVAVLSIALFCVSHAAAASTEAKANLRDCMSTTLDVDLRIRACTDLIQSPGSSKDELETALIQRGSLYNNLRRLDEAIADENRALELNPKSALAHFYRGVTYLNLKRNDEALLDFDAAIRLEPNFVGAYMGRGQLYVRINHDDEAIADFKSALKLDPRYVDAFLALGDEYIKLVMCKEALDNYTKAEVVTSNFYVYARHALVLSSCPDAKMRNDAKAVELGELARRLGFDNPISHDALAAAYAEAGRFDDAIAEEQQAITLWKESKDDQAISDAELRLRLYQQHLPYRLPVPARDASPG